MNNAISWFEIPTNDLERATKFYETILGIQMIPMDMPNLQMRLFPVDDMQTGISGALVYNTEFYNSSANDGVMIYLNANPDVQVVLDKVEAAGGKVIVPKTEISPEHGFMAVIIDTENNRIAFHSIP